MLEVIVELQRPASLSWSYQTKKPAHTLAFTLEKIQHGPGLMLVSDKRTPCLNEPATGYVMGLLCTAAFSSSFLTFHTCFGDQGAVWAFRSILPVRVGQSSVDNQDEASALSDMDR
jgi:hypothetical protein